MRQTRADRVTSGGRPVVAVAVDTSWGYGRSIVRGFMRYANAPRRWALAENLHMGAPGHDRWPDCAGAVFAGASRDIYRILCRHSRHVVCCSGDYQPEAGPVLCIDDAAVGRTAAEHLLGCRLSRFAYYGRSARPVSVNRLQGFRAKLAEQGFACEVAPVDWPDVHGPMERPHWPGLLDWLTRLAKPVGVFAMDDSAACDLAAACLHLGLDVPDGVAILGVNNDELQCEGAWPPLSSVDLNAERLGYAAGALLDRLLSGQPPTDGQRLTRLPPGGVVRRASTDVLAIDDPHVSAAVAFIREHACDPCTVGDLLRHVPVGRRWLERKFEEKLGRTPHDQITRVRIETACHLLATSADGLPEISARCGFAAVQGFRRAFRKVTGQSPAAYRRSQRR